MANSEEKVFLYENAAVVAGIYHAKGQYKGKAFDHYGRFTDTWVFTNGKWLCVASHTSPLKKPRRATLRLARPLPSHPVFSRGSSSTGGAHLLKLNAKGTRSWRA